MKDKKIVWYVACQHIRKMGPYPTQLAAAKAAMGHDGIPVKGFTCWPEEEK